MWNTHHGTRLPLFQFHSTINLGEEKHEKYAKVSSTDSRKVRELPSF